MNIFFSSDQHFGHSNIIKYCNRPFSGVDEMRRVLMDNWNAKVGPRDRVYVLGDFSWGNNEYTRRILEGLNGEKYFLVGNHDRIKSEAKGLEAGFAWVGHQLQYQLGPFLVDMCHYPYHNDMEGNGEPDKFSHKRPLDRGRWLLHGHTHQRQLVRERMVSVGVDAWNYAPVSQEELIAVIKGE